MQKQNSFVVLFKNSGCPLQFMMAALCLAFSHQDSAIMMNSAACTEIVLKPVLTVMIIYFLGFLYAQNSTKRSIKERLMKLLPCSAAKTTSPVTQSKFYFSFDFFFFFFRFACIRSYTFINCSFDRQDICWSNHMVYWGLKGSDEEICGLGTDLSVQSRMARNSARVCRIGAAGLALLLHKLAEKWLPG